MFVKIMYFVNTPTFRDMTYCIHPPVYRGYVFVTINIYWALHRDNAPFALSVQFCIACASYTFCYIKR